MRLQNDYIGSINARLQSLTIGAKGLMLNTKRSIKMQELLGKRVVLELEEIKSGSEKALLMGFVLSSLGEALKAKHKEIPQFKHITLVEEAHRLLSKYTPGDSLNKKQSVETFADMLAEVRKYGESLVIVDQIPAKLTPEVLKNTNSKIVHKIFAQDDKEAIGNTMVLADEQKSFLSNLETGRAIVFTQGWPKALQIQIKKCTNTTGEEVVEEQLIRNRALAYYCKVYKTGIFPSLAELKQAPTKEFLDNFMELIMEEEFVENYKEFFLTMEIKEDLLKSLEELTCEISIEEIARYLQSVCYTNREIECKLIVEFLGKINSKEMLNASEKIKYKNKLSCL